MDQLALLKRVKATHEAFKSEVKPGEVLLPHFEPLRAGKARAMGLALLEDMYGKASQYYSDFQERTASHVQYDYEIAAGIVEAVYELVANDWLEKTRGLIAGEVFTDFLDMSEHLLDEGYKDAAAVMAGSSMEAHLKRLASNAGVSLTVTNSKGDVVPKKADTINADLAKAAVLDKNEQKQVTAWLAIRNEAAHGHYQAVDSNMVRVMISGIRHLVLSHPA